MDTLAPNISLANKYLTTRSRDSKVMFKTAFDDMADGSNNTLSSMTGRDVHNGLFVSKGVNLSLWNPFTLNHTFLF